jgi:regulator of replication initiation timing
MNQLQEEHTQSLDEIKLKIQKLITHYHSLAEHCKVLEIENEKLKHLLAEQKNKAISLEENNKITKIASTLVDSADDIPALRKMLNEYIRQVDECIRFLSEKQIT